MVVLRIMYVTYEQQLIPLTTELEHGILHPGRYDSLWVLWQVICQAVRKHILEVFHTPPSPIGAGTQGLLVRSANAKCIGTCQRESWTLWYVGHLCLFSLWDTDETSHCRRREGNYLVFVMLRNNSIVLSYFSVASPIFHFSAWISFRSQVRIDLCK